jgi:hypothetical protein
MEKAFPQQLGPEETQKVLRRAAELDRQHATVGASIGAAHEPRIDAVELERIAAESGLSPEAVGRALDELSGGTLAVVPKRGGASARRTYDGAARGIEERLAAAMLRNGLSPIERTPLAIRWEPARGVRHAVGRALDLEGAGAWLGATVESSVYSIPGDRCSAELVGDVKDMTLPIATILALVLAFPAGIALLVLLAIGLRAGVPAQHGLGMLLVIATWAALTALISRGVARSRMRKLQRALERILAQIGA